MEMESDRDLLERMKSLIHVTKRVHVKDAAAMLDLDHVTFLKKVMAWGKTIPFKIDGDDIIVEDVAAVIESIDHQFSQWDSTNVSKSEKLDSTSDVVRSGGRGREDEWKEQFDSGRKAMQEEKWLIASKAFRIARAIKPDHLDTLYGLGMALQNLNDWSNVIEVYQKLISLQPNEAWTWYGLGSAQLTLGDFMRSVESFKKAVSLKDNEPKIWTGLAIALGRQEDWAGGVVACNRALALERNNVEVWKYLGNFLGLMGDYKASIKACKQAIDISPKDHEAWKTLSAALHNAGHFWKSDEAEKKARRYELESKQKII